MTSKCLKIITLYIQLEGPPLIIAESSNCQLEFDADRINGMSNQIISNL
jgi:hypothetical protein